MSALKSLEYVSKDSTPMYWGIRGMSFILIGLGVLSIVSGPVFGAILWLSASSRPFEDVAGIGGAFAVGACGVVSGIVLIAGGQLLACIRDIAINSFLMMKGGS